MRAIVSVMTGITILFMTVFSPIVSLITNIPDAGINCGGIKENRCDGDMYIKEVISCTVAGKYFMGVYHPIECQIERIYCYTDEYCNGCGQYYDSYDPDTAHLCTYEHTKVDASGTLCPYTNATE